MKPRCSFCNTELVEGGDDKLDQSGDSYLPARRWDCPGPKCRVEKVSLKTGARWEPYHPPKKDEAQAPKPMAAIAAG